ncbi:tRNA lysidine(34) synthetase TilS [Ectopseudomonas toyotomiensis]|uniref:tRNA(Ile)-lysidine synthase n=1 Tax=Ectopseudomonas toyotomiensis TaxID=554344 RepID=A0AA42IMF0_9GAMM|nr:tRNA lysidine(34) synthetase TilS [Pseudomonas toyotomiensis]MBG0843144.1 tRNA lysidine(34) synthetase TilS [Pseudomonas toyotomiensis]MDH0702473.1 tRNA lysidine(34) synthetase TilS [Pseudomonas toyotomiensis]
MTALELRLRQALQPWRTAPAWRIAFSGGLDSSVLLHLLADWARHEELPPLYAIHVHHGLQSAGDAWPAHCARVCEQLGIALEVVRVQVAPGASLEQAARSARYQAFCERLKPGEVLLSAQHRDDQAETLLFRLLRGAGVRGLAAMPASRSLGQGGLFRPLLDSSRAELREYAQSHGLAWIEDPSNADERFSRNFLRRQVMPLLAERWPQVTANIARSARHLGEAQQLLDELAAMDLAAAHGVSTCPWLTLPSLDLSAVSALSDRRQRNLLRHWLAPLTRLPDSDHWAGWCDLRDAATDAAPIWKLTDGELHRADGRLWWLSGEWLRPLDPLALACDSFSESVELPDNGHVHLQGELPQGRWHLRYRQGGESLLLPGRGRRDLKRLLNELRVPAFVRPRLPLLFAGDKLMAVANLSQSSEIQAGGVRLHWSPPIGAQGLSW